MNDAIAYALSKGWRWEKRGDGHTFGYLYCTADSGGKHEEIKCMVAVFSTPKNPTNHAKKIRKTIDNYNC
ncbi:hypothetical protein WDV76_03880 [Xenorhabdus griffiniae]|uniref:hypothetical protein n=1 Tax=Xenorhabdus griffiniae TaxID=351672 RepID=UPI0023584692|nr:hypothetical protein [Xenorhabdus griffiniae]MDC9607160.1 hypothetical protein [Xenorhabdus griffiniae]